MYILISFLSKTEKINDLIHKMREQGFTGGTLFDGFGMRKVMPKVFDIPLVASLHSIFDEEGQINKVLFCVLENMEEVEQLSGLIEDVMGDLHKPNTGLIIAFKLDYVKGYDRWKNSDL